MSDIHNILRMTALVAEISMQAARTASEAQSLILNAQAEGRDISDDELVELRSRSESMLDKWRRATG